MSIELSLPAENPSLRERSVNAVLDALRLAPRGSRAELAAQTGLSKPTVASALRALQGGGLVRERGRSTGRRGPSASLYEPVADAALVLGVDIGAHHVRAVLADLDGEPRDEAKVAVRRPDAEHVIDALRAVRAALDDRSIELAVVGSPGVVDPASGRIRSSPNIAGWEGVQAEAVIGEALGVATSVDNDVNLAALGELARGAGRGRTTFAYLSVGSGLGAGLVLDGRVHRGRHGAAGEVGYLAVGADPAADATASLGPMEKQLSQDAIVNAAARVDAAAPRDPRELFARARRGDALGLAAVAQTIDGLAICIASITAVLDLDLVLLGGGIGEQGDLLLEPVRAALSGMVPYSPDIEVGTLGDHAVLTGAAAEGATLARAAVIRRCLAVTPRPRPNMGNGVLPR
jgi:predicted NBD/HSP70 family sugar kinase